jgi:beta-galactosidase
VKNRNLRSRMELRSQAAPCCSIDGLLGIILLAVVCTTLQGPSAAGRQNPDRPAVPRQQSLNGEWNLWFDPKANWQAEEVVLHPSDMAEVPLYPPTVGWDEMLKLGKPYRVPATWNEVYPRQHGVGWYWRPVRIPTSAKGKVIRLRFGAVRLRAEVFWNRRLVGYNLEGSTPFEVDITPFVRYDGDNLLAVRVTNPGGGTSSTDTVPIRWGKVALPDSRDCGGIWQDVDLLVTPPAFNQNVYVAPLEDLKTIRVISTIVNRSQAQTARLHYSVVDLPTLRVVAQMSVQQHLKANTQEVLTNEIGIPNPNRWSPETPHRYKLIAHLVATREADESETTFGVRYFTEKNGKLFLNGGRIFIRSSINFGYYPYTVIYPTPDLAEKEVRTAKALGLNTLSCHRSACTPALLEAADRLGLLIYQEPGGAPRERQPEPESAAEAFERQIFLEKLNRLVARDRNHPSLIWWNLANEAFGDVVNDPTHLAPYIDQMMQTMHRLDPSRFATYTSAHQSTVIFRPFEKNYGLIYDAHTVANVPAVWRDTLSLEHSTFEAPVSNEAFTTVRVVA